MEISARNQLAGTVKSITKGTVMAEVVILLDGGQELVAAVTARSVEKLGLKEGVRVTSIIKATEVMLGVDEKSDG